VSPRSRRRSGTWRTRRRRQVRGRREGQDGGEAAQRKSGRRSQSGMARADGAEPKGETVRREKPKSGATIRVRVARARSTRSVTARTRKPSAAGDLTSLAASCGWCSRQGDDRWRDASRVISPAADGSSPNARGYCDRIYAHRRPQRDQDSRVSRRHDPVRRRDFDGAGHTVMVEQGAASARRSPTRRSSRREPRSFRRRKRSGRRHGRQGQGADRAPSSR